MRLRDAAMALAAVIASSLLVNGRISAPAPAAASVDAECRPLASRSAMAGSLHRRVLGCARVAQELASEASTAGTPMVARAARLLAAAQGLYSILQPDQVCQSVADCCERSQLCLHPQGVSAIHSSRLAIGSVALRVGREAWELPAGALPEQERLAAVAAAWAATSLLALPSSGRLTGLRGSLMPMVEAADSSPWAQFLVANCHAEAASSLDRCGRAASALVSLGVMARSGVRVTMEINVADWVRPQSPPGSLQFVEEAALASRLAAGIATRDDFVTTLLLAEKGRAAGGVLGWLAAAASRTCAWLAGAEEGKGVQELKLAWSLLEQHGPAPRAIMASGRKAYEVATKDMVDAIWVITDEKSPNTPDSAVAISVALRAARYSVGALGAEVRKALATRQALRVRSGLDAGCRLNASLAAHRGFVFWDGGKCPGANSRDFVPPSGAALTAATVRWTAMRAPSLAWSVAQFPSAPRFTLSGEDRWWCDAWAKGAAAVTGGAGSEAPTLPCPCSLVLEGEIRSDPGAVDPFWMTRTDHWGSAEESIGLWRRNVAAAVADGAGALAAAGARRTGRYAPATGAAGSRAWWGHLPSSACQFDPSTTASVAIVVPGTATITMVNGSVASAAPQTTWATDFGIEQRFVYKRPGRALALSARWPGMPMDVGPSMAQMAEEAALAGLAWSAGVTEADVLPDPSRPPLFERLKSLHPLLEPGLMLENELLSHRLPDLVVAASAARWSAVNLLNHVNPDATLNSAFAFAAGFPEGSSVAWSVICFAMFNNGHRGFGLLASAAGVRWRPWHWNTLVNTGTLAAHGSLESAKTAAVLSWADALSRALEAPAEGRSLADDTLASAPVAVPFSEALPLRQYGAGTPWGAVTKSPVAPVQGTVDRRGLVRARRPGDAEDRKVGVPVDDATGPLVAAASAFPDADAAAALTRAGIPQSPGPLVAWKPELDEIHSLNEPGEWLWIFSPGGGVSNTRPVSITAREQGVPPLPVLPAGNLSESGGHRECDWTDCTSHGRRLAKLSRRLLQARSDTRPPGSGPEPDPCEDTGNADRRDLAARLDRVASLLFHVLAPVDAVCPSDVVERAFPPTTDRALAQLGSRAALRAANATLRLLETLGYGRVAASVAEATGACAPPPPTHQRTAHGHSSDDVLTAALDEAAATIRGPALDHQASQWQWSQDAVTSNLLARGRSGDQVAAYWRATQIALASPPSIGAVSASIAICPSIVSSRQEVAPTRAAFAGTMVQLLRARLAAKALEEVLRQIAPAKTAGTSSSAVADAVGRAAEAASSSNAWVARQSERPFYISYHGRGIGSALIVRLFELAAAPDHLPAGPAAERLRAAQCAAGRELGGKRPAQRLSSWSPTVELAAKTAVAMGRCALRPAVAAGDLLDMRGASVALAMRAGARTNERSFVTLPNMQGKLAASMAVEGLSLPWWRVIPAEAPTVPPQLALLAGSEQRAAQSLGLRNTTKWVMHQLKLPVDPGASASPSSFSETALASAQTAWKPLPRPLGLLERAALAAGSDPCLALGLRKARVGFISSFFRVEHPHGHVLRAAAAGLDRSFFEVVLIRLTPFIDIDPNITLIADSVVDVSADKLEGALRAVKLLGLDAVIFSDQLATAAGFMLGSQRFAPVQAVFGGDPMTSGHSNSLDYFMGGDRTEGDGSDVRAPEDLSQQPVEERFGAALYAEQLVRLEGQGYSYDPAPSAVPPLSLAERLKLALPQGGGDGVSSPVLIGCIQSSFKLSPSLDDVFAAVLRSLPKAQILLIAARHPSWQAKLEARWVRVMPDVVSRMFVSPRTAPGEPFMKLMASVDMVIHPLPFGGSRTAADSLAAGVPFVSMPSRLVTGRMARSLLASIGADALMATSPSHMVRILLRLAASPETRRALGESMMHRSHLAWNRPEVAMQWQAFLMTALRLPVRDRRWTQRLIAAQQAADAAALREAVASDPHGDLLGRPLQGCSDQPPSPEEALRWGEGVAARLAGEHTLFAAGAPAVADWER